MDTKNLMVELEKEIARLEASTMPDLSVSSDGSLTPVKDELFEKLREEFTKAIENSANFWLTPIIGQSVSSDSMDYALDALTYSMAHIPRLKSKKYGIGEDWCYRDGLIYTGIDLGSSCHQMAVAHIDQDGNLTQERPMMISHSPKCECGAHSVGSKLHSSWCEIKE